MSLINTVAQKILEKKIVDILPISGGCIAQTYKIVTSDNKAYFIKHLAQFDILVKECEGLKTIAETKTIRVPEVIAVQDNLLILEWMEHHSMKNENFFFEQFGRDLATLHTQTYKHFGFKSDNYLGLSHQKNRTLGKAMDSWTEFYKEYRLNEQIKLAKKNGLLTHKLETKYNELIKKLPELLYLNEQEKPCLIHGDLWAGNFICAQNDQPVIIDPAAYYGNRELELAMTHLFGGFSSNFYHAYNKEYPLASGYKKRIPLYQLYHLLNHLNLFGNQYYNQVCNAIDYYL